MFNLFLSKKGVNSEFLKNNYFLFNGKKMDPYDDKTRIDEYGIINGNIINFGLLHNIVGAKVLSKSKITFVFTH